MSDRRGGPLEWVAGAIFRAAVATLPGHLGPFRHEMWLDFLASYREARAGGLAAAVGYAARAVLDVIRVGALERARGRAAQPHRPRRLELGAFADDVRYALRALRKTPGFTAVAVITLGLGIGANAAIYSVIDSVLLRPLPFRESEQLLQLWEGRADRGWRSTFTHGNFWELRDLATLDGVDAIRFGYANLTGAAEPERVGLGHVSDGFFSTLGVSPLEGRLFARGESDPGGEPHLLLLSSAFWRNRLAGDPAIVGKTLTLDGEGYTVIGVLPNGTPWLDYADAYVPLIRNLEYNVGSFELELIARMPPGGTLDGTKEMLARVARELEQRHPEMNRGIGIEVERAEEWTASSTLRRSLWILMGAVGFLLLIACVNLANLLLARATGRTRERSLRAALGATRARIVRQVVTESLVLSGIGALVGLAIALAVTRVLRAFDPGGIPRLADASVDWTVLGFTAVATILTGLLTAISPALQAGRADLVGSLRETERSPAGGRALGRLRSLFVTIEVAASVSLLIGAGLLLRSFANVLDVDRGFATEDRELVTVSLPGSYPEERRDEFMRQLSTRLEAVPGVRSIGLVSQPPLRGVGTGMGLASADHPPPPDGTVPWASWRLVSGEYFGTLGVSLLRGRTFDPSDRIASPWRAVVSQSVAERLWPGQDPVGRQILLWPGQDQMPGEVIGVVSDMRDWGLTEGPSLAVYLPIYGSGQPILHVVAHADPGALTQASVRSILDELDSSVPLSRVRSLSELVDESIASRRFLMLLLVAFAGVALVMALAGIYGVLSYSVSRRTGEIGVRLALGASHRKVLRLIVAQGMAPVVVGLGIGVAGSLAMGRLMAAMLFDLAPSDLATHVAVTLALTAMAALSCYLPARQALRVDVVASLRRE